MPSVWSSSFHEKYMMINVQILLSLSIPVPSFPSASSATTATTTTDTWCHTSLDFLNDSRAFLYLATDIIKEALFLVIIRTWRGLRDEDLLRLLCFYLVISRLGRFVEFSICRCKIKILGWHNYRCSDGGRGGCFRGRLGMRLRFRRGLR